jgi:hypothetical protein
VRSHPHRATDLAAFLRTKPCEQVLVVELLGDGGEDGGPAHGAQAQHPQSFALGRIALLLAQVLDVLDEGSAQPLVGLRPIKPALQSQALGQAGEQLED